ncbi:hypothetical protein L7F22_002490 [Adiantum nelumboides]|nr:hypothetical protein [Adiantum nelumboides]
MYLQRRDPDIPRRECKGRLRRTDGQDATGEEATYEPSRRSIKWLKVKKDYLAGTGDSLDLVVIGAYYGKARGPTYGAFLLACYDSDNESYQAVCKLGTGFSEEDLELHHSTLKQLEVAGKRGYYDEEADDATGPEQIAEMYRKQATASKSGKGGADEDDGYW